MGKDDGGSGFGLVLLALFILSVGLFYVFGSFFEFSKPLHKKVFGIFSKKSLQPISSNEGIFSPEIVVLPKENEWCKIQEMRVSEIMESPSRDQIEGWDNIQQCCIRTVTGYNCALQRESHLSYCYTGNIGGIIKWASVDNYGILVNDYQRFFVDYSKDVIPNKPCDITKYPQELRIMV